MSVRSPQALRSTGRLNVAKTYADCRSSRHCRGQEEYEASPTPFTTGTGDKTDRYAQRLRPMSYSKSHVILIAFAIDTPDSLDNVSVKVRRPRHTTCSLL